MDNAPADDANAQPAQPLGVQPPTASTPAAAGQQPVIININGATGPQQPPQTVYVNAPKSHRTRNVLVGCAVGVVGLGLLGRGCASDLYSGTPNYQGPTVTVPSHTPTPPPPLSHVAPKIANSAIVGVYHVGNQNWVDVTVTLTNQGTQPVQNVVLYLEQNGSALAITDTGGWNGIPNGVQLPSILGIGESMPVTLRVEQWTPGQPIAVVIGGNGVNNDASIAKIACPIPAAGGEIQTACTLVG